MPENKKDLLPFYKSRTGPGNGEFFNSDDAKTTELFGYVYDDFVGINAGDIPALRKRVDEKYVWASRTPTHPNITDPPLNMKPLDVRSTYFFSKESEAPTQLFTMASTNGGAATTNPGKAAFAGVANTITSSLQAAVESVPAHAHNITNDGQHAIATSLASTKIDSKFDREWYVDSVVKR